MLAALAAGAAPNIPNPDTTGLQPAVVERIREVRQAVIERPDAMETWSRLGGACAAHSFLACADEAYARVQELAPNDFRWPYLRANVLMVLGREHDTVIDLLRRALELAPEYAPAHYRLGQVLAGSGRREEAVVAYTKAVDLQPDLAIAHRGLGQVHYALGETERAIQELEHAARLQPEDGAVFASLAAAYGRSGDRGRAQKAARRSRRLQPIDEFADPVRNEVLSDAVHLAALEKRAGELFRERRYEEALPLLETVNQLRPDDPYVLRILGRANRMAGNLGRAERHLAAALRAKPDMLDVRLGLASLFVEQGRNDEAIQQYRLASRYDPDRAHVRLSLAGLLLRTERFKEAAMEYARAAQRAPLSPDAQMRWGWALFRAGSFQEAAEKLQAVVQAEPDNARAHQLLARTYEQLGEAEKAAAHRRLADGAPKNPGPPDID